jgi:hypothetical protein
MTYFERVSAWSPSEALRFSILSCRSFSKTDRRTRLVTFQIPRLLWSRTY